MKLGDHLVLLRHNLLEHVDLGLLLDWLRVLGPRAAGINNTLMVRDFVRVLMDVLMVFVLLMMLMLVLMLMFVLVMDVRVRVVHVVWQRVREGVHVHSIVDAMRLDVRLRRGRVEVDVHDDRRRRRLDVDGFLRFCCLCGPLGLSGDGVQGGNPREMGRESARGDR